MSGLVVETRDLKRVYEEGSVEVHALGGVDFSVSQGEFVSIVGPSGSGKSTLLHLIGGLDRPTSGTVWVDGVELNDLNEGALTDLRLQKLGFVFQSYNLIPVLSAQENVEFILQLQGIAKEERANRASSVLDALGLGDLHDRRPGDMSGGQQQRVAIARAIVTDPVVLLADEPSANLDSRTTQEFCEVLKTINESQGVTIVTATHDPLVMGYTRTQIELQDGLIKSAAA